MLNLDRRIQYRHFDQTNIPSKELVGKVASEIKALKPVEPYKGKGIKERGQYVLRKEGKKK